MIHEIAEQDLAKCSQNKQSLAVEELLQLSNSRLNNVIRQFLANQQISMPSVAQLEQIKSQLLHTSADKQPSIQLQSIWLRRFKQHIYSCRSYRDISDWTAELSLITTEPIQLDLPDNIGMVNFTYNAQNQEYSPRLRLPADAHISIVFSHNNPLVLPDYRHKQRPLKKVLQELNVPPWLRARIPFIYYKNDRNVAENDTMQGAYLGPECSNQEVELMARKFKAVYEKFDDFEELADKTADLITNANVIGWHQGRMEFGPRALGNRSILGDPTNTEMQRKINLKIKYRESFRPFAPSVLAEDSSTFFDLDGKDSPYMLLVADVNQAHCKPIPDNYYEIPLRERLYVLRSDIQSITHIDFSARVQSVHQNTNPKYYTLLQKMKAKNGVGMVINTSFNVRGEPIVCTPEDSYRCFMRTEMDYLVINNYLFQKTAQPEWDKKDNWKEEFVLD